MRIVYVSRGYGPHDRRFLAAQVAAGLQVGFLRLGGRRGRDEPLPAGVELVLWGGGRETPAVRWPPLLAGQLRSALERARPDVVHAGPIQDVVLWAALAGVRPLVAMSWGFDLLQDARRGLGRWAARRALRGADLLLCDCDAVRGEAVGLGMDADRIVVFPWGVDLRRFRPGRSRTIRRALAWEKEFILLVTRSWERRYGIEVLLDAFTAAVRREPRLRLLLIGDGSLKSEVLRRMGDPEVGSRVYLPGVVDQEWLPAFYHSADLYVSPSHVDGTSVSLLEAMACGLAVAVSDIPGNREWVQPGAQGWWFPDGDTHGLADVLVEAPKRRERLDRMGRRNRYVVERRADWRRAPRLLADAYARAARISRESR